MEFKLFNPLISILTIKAYWSNLTIISVYNLIEEKTPEEKDDFYDELTNVVDGIPNNKIVIILGDINAKVGNELIFKPTIGHYSLHEVTNNNGLNLIDFASSKGLVIKSTMFPHKKIHKGTWKSPDGIHTNQIDHLLVNDRFKNSITDVKTMRGADCDSDRYLVKVKIKAKLKRRVATRPTIIHRYDIIKFTDEVCRKHFKSEIHKRSRELDIDSTGSINNMWRRIQEQDTIKETSAEVLGKPKNTKNPWFNERCEKALNQR